MGAKVAPLAVGRGRDSLEVSCSSPVGTRRTGILEPGSGGDKAGFLTVAVLITGGGDPFGGLGCMGSIIRLRANGEGWEGSSKFNCLLVFMGTRSREDVLEDLGVPPVEPLDGDPLGGRTRAECLLAGENSRVLVRWN